MPSLLLMYETASISEIAMLAVGKKGRDRGDEGEAEADRAL